MTSRGGKGGPGEGERLRRELGFWDALTIGAGTMIGAGIFLLAGVAVDLTGPGAIFSYAAGGLVCILTAASAAQLATGMPTSGGDHFFVSRALGPALGAISGVGIWLSLTVAIAPAHFQEVEGKEALLLERPLDAEGPRRVMVALANPATRRTCWDSAGGWRRGERRRAG